MLNIPINKITILSTIIIFYLVSQTYAQTQRPGFGCETSISSVANTPFGMGLTKPMKTLPTTNTGISFRVLMVFVEFSNESGSSSHWTAGNLPDYAYDLFAPEKQTGLNAYEDYLISDYFNKISNDQFDVIGDVYHVILSQEYSRYGSMAEAETEVFSILDNNLGVDWDQYDLWRWNAGTEQFEHAQDDYIDMAYVQYRMVNAFGISHGGLGANQVDYITSDYKHITTLGIDYLGTGVTGYNGANLDILAVTGLFRHEYCHYTLGNHRPYSTVAGGDGTQYAFGYELGFAPQDLITVGLGNISTYTGSTNSFVIDDMTTTGDVLKVPSTNSGEFFLVSNRQRVAGNGIYTWDCNMAGDTALGIPFKQIEDYSKGLYIYHVINGNDFQAMVDLECADGLWNWGIDGATTPDWHPTQQLPVFLKTGVGYFDDNPGTDISGSTRMASRDGHSVVDYTNSINHNPPEYHNKWFTPGERHTELNDPGIDRIFTNKEENWCSRETMGDRWDAWKNNYNEVFSPYSSPNTKDRGGNQTGIFIYLDTILGGEATINVYQADANSLAEVSILAATPPSKPMLYKPVEVVNCNGTYGYPRITWDNNLEPDMNDWTGGYRHKKYLIFRAISTNSNYAPQSYTQIGTYNDYTPDDTANFTDNNVLNGAIVYCSDEGNGGNDTYFRYHIVAVDSYNDESVPSDFVSIKGHSIIPDRPGHLTEEPSVFELSQNYPNPFNPSTQINFALPQNSFVTVKVYNAIGEEVARLVNNEFKSAGSYSVTFDGSNFGSGIYFYSIETGQFKETKKMVLIK